MRYIGFSWEGIVAFFFFGGKYDEHRRRGARIYIFISEGVFSSAKGNGTLKEYPGDASIKDQKFN